MGGDVRAPSEGADGGSRQWCWCSCALAPSRRGKVREGPQPPSNRRAGRREGSSRARPSCHSSLERAPKEKIGSTAAGDGRNRSEMQGSAAAEAMLRRRRDRDAPLLVLEEGNHICLTREEAGAASHRGERRCA
ncbi:hypothetical protein PVAP13_3NG162563 [Panicum virgatum]|uniref:Uncharacterized protein n=1 Tax=Panicum virgatum TaxID=38727 RepID=A0A8T0UJL2_PANVG|nr:hypothetical protein PVAP13_3NG162563 [Panicum virgatum]